ncbi:MAG: flippase-like domain-containing protein [Deltaproteobacteria bacterium]|nr:flippase-like domain-containing protein [Deltaproteobacteria bacterium]
MKRLKIINNKNLIQVIGLIIGLAAVFLSIKNVKSDLLWKSLSSMNIYWILPIIAVNFVVIGFKAGRWMILIGPVKKIGFWVMYRVLTISMMANNILPARMGEIARFYILGKEASISQISTAATILSDRIIEGISFLIMSFLLISLVDVPKWMERGLYATLAITLAIYILGMIYSKRSIKNSYLERIQKGIAGLVSPKLLSSGLIISFISWILQGLLIYMIQVSFNVQLPLWGVVLVLLSVNLIIAVPSAPAQIGTFEFAAVFAYTYLGLDNSTAFLLGATYHILQVVPVTIAGSVLLLTKNITSWKNSQDLAVPY